MKAATSITVLGLLGLLVSPASVRAEDRFKLSELIVNENVKAGKPYDVAFRYEGQAIEVSEVCFLWSGEGPFCWTNMKIDKKAKLIKTQAKTGNPNTYTLSGFVRYGNSNDTNRVSKAITVTP